MQAENTGFDLPGEGLLHNLSPPDSAAVVIPGPGGAQRQQDATAAFCSLWHISNSTNLHCLPSIWFPGAAARCAVPWCHEQRPPHSSAPAGPHCQRNQILTLAKHIETAVFAWNSKT